MSWYSGSQETRTSRAGTMSPPSQQASTFADSTRSGIITPFGSLVEPLVYCRMTRRSGSGAGTSQAVAARDAGGTGQHGADRLDRRVARGRPS